MLQKKAGLQNLQLLHGRESQVDEIVRVSY